MLRGRAFFLLLAIFFSCTLPAGVLAPSTGGANTQIFTMIGKSFAQSGRSKIWLCPKIHFKELDLSPLPKYLSSRNCYCYYTRTELSLISTTKPLANISTQHGGLSWNQHYLTRNSNPLKIPFHNTRTSQHSSMSMIPPEMILS